MKDHEADLPENPIVSKWMGPTYRIEKVLWQILKEYLPESENTLKSKILYKKWLNNVEWRLYTTN